MYVINIIGGPGVGKSTYAAELFVEMKKRGIDVEFIQEYAKKLVWLERWDDLNDQYRVSKKQYQLLKQLEGKVDYVITDTSLLIGLYHNSHNPDNVSDKIKTKDKILEWMYEFKNIFICLDRDPKIKYKTEGRIESVEKAKDIDKALDDITSELNIDDVLLSGKCPIPTLLDGLLDDPESRVFPQI